MVVEQVGTANREVIAAVSNKNIFHMLQVGALENGAFLFLHAVPSFALPAAFFGSSARPSEPLSICPPSHNRLPPVLSTPFPPPRALTAHPPPPRALTAHPPPSPCSLTLHFPVLPQLFVDGIKAANVTNGMVVALDDATEKWLVDRNVPHYLKKLVSRTGSTDNHATSGLKFKILVDFLSIGCSVLLSDVDVIWLYALLLPLCISLFPLTEFPRLSRVSPLSLTSYPLTEPIVFLTDLLYLRQHPRAHPRAHHPPCSHPAPQCPC